MMAALDGAQTGETQWALLKSIPRFASRSMFGVWTVPS
jgi:hypothetical protein